MQQCTNKELVKPTAYIYSIGFQWNLFCIFLNFIVFSMNLQILNELIGDLNRKSISKIQKNEIVSGHQSDQCLAVPLGWWPMNRGSGNTSRHDRRWCTGGSSTMRSSLREPAPRGRHARQGNEDESAPMRWGDVRQQNSPVRWCLVVESSEEVARRSFQWSEGSTRPAAHNGWKRGGGGWSRAADGEVIMVAGDSMLRDLFGHQLRGRKGQQGSCNTEQVVTHIRQCHDNLNRCTPNRGRTWPTYRTHGPTGLMYDNHPQSPY
jgi:hypothetical protein